MEGYTEGFGCFVNTLVVLPCAQLVVISAIVAFEVELMTGDLYPASWFEMSRT
jgi:hypothetical protein